jgi:hypothetical protein
VTPLRSPARLALALTITFAITASVSGCERIAGLLGDESAPATKVEAYVDEPYTLDALRKRAQAGGSRFEQHERDDRSGASCHGVVCLMVAPFLLAGALFPERWIEVIVVGDASAPSYRGTFRRDGTLIAMKIEQGALAREVALLDLRAVKRKVMVEIARRPAGSQDEESPWPRTPIVGQVDLRPAYAAAASRASSAEEKSKVLVEALGVLDGDSLPLLNEQLKPGAAHRSDALTDLIELACFPPNGKVSAAAAQALFALASHGATHRTAHTALTCARAWPLELSPSQASGLAMQLVSGYCAGSFRSLLFEDYEWMARVVVDYASASLAPSTLAKCEDPLRRAGVRLAFDQPVARGELEPLFTSKEQEARRILQFMDCPWPGGDKLSSPDESFACVSKLAASSAEVAARANEYVRAVSAGELATASALLARFNETVEQSAHGLLPHDQLITRAARAAIERARSGSSSDAASALELGLYCLGEEQHASAIHEIDLTKASFSAKLLPTLPNCGQQLER